MSVYLPPLGRELCITGAAGVGPLLQQRMHGGQGAMTLQCSEGSHSECMGGEGQAYAPPLWLEEKAAEVEAVLHTRVQ